MRSDYVDDLVDNYPSPVKHYDQVVDSEDDGDDDDHDYGDDHGDNYLHRSSIMIRWLIKMILRY